MADGQEQENRQDRKKENTEDSKAGGNVQDKSGEKDQRSKSGDKPPKNSKADLRQGKSDNKSAADKSLENAKNKSLAQEIQEAAKDKTEPDDSENEELAFFTRKKQEKDYSIWSIDEFIHDYLEDWNSVLVYMFEVIAVSVILLLPSLFWLIKEWRSINLLSYFGSPGAIKADNEGLFRIALFTILWYTFDVTIVIFSDNFLLIMDVVLYTFQLSESEFCWCMVDVLYTSRGYFRISADCLFIFYLSVRMFEKYSKPKSFNIFNPLVVKTLILWFGIYMGMLFVMKFVINIFIYDVRRSSYKEVIWDLNHKVFLFRKLSAISETHSQSERNDIAENMIPTYDPGFYLKDKDLFTSREDAMIVVQNTMALLKKKKLTYQDIKAYYPNEYDAVFKYFTSSDTVEDSQIVHVKALKEIARDLYIKRKDMGKTLNDRDSIFEKLEVIFFLIVSYIAAVILCILFDIDYQFYLFGFGTTLLTFSWVFADTIKKIFNCFVFVLVLRPYVIGDKVKINGEEYVVVKIDLLTSTFLNNTKTIIYLPNDVLMVTKIHNISRSPPQCMVVELAVENATYSQVKKLEESVKDKLKDKEIKKHFIDAELIEKSADKAVFSVSVIQNFQNTSLTKERQDRLIKIFESSLSSANITHKNSFVFTMS